ncbi:MAG: PspC domain-containing protein [Pseudomonadales bacterium]|nr:PspC domain-containing protein [Pseudomonadales bacterium]
MLKLQIGANKIPGAKLNDSENNRGDRSEREREGRDFSVAMTRLEKAVQELVTATTGEITDRATSLLDDTSKRLESELRLKRVADEHPEEQPAHEQRRRRHRHRHRFSDSRRGGELYIDPSDEKVAGVCAALARYFGVETWIMRMGALTGLIFVPGVIFPAYWIAYFVMEKRSDGTVKSKRKRRRRGSRMRRRAEKRQASAIREDENDMTHESFDEELADDGPVVKTRLNFNRGSNSDGEPPFNAGRGLRHITTDMTQAELRLRRLESFVTSDKYELHKELAKIEREGSTT